MFFGRMTYEGIFLTYKYGPQMIGFSLIHLHPILYIFMILSFLGSIIWIIIYSIWMIKVLSAKSKPKGIWIFFSTVLIIALTLLITI